MENWIRLTGQHMGEMAELFQKLADDLQIVVSVKNQRLPMGLRVSVRRLQQSTDFALATKVFLDELGQNGTLEVLTALQQGFGSESKVCYKYVTMQGPDVTMLIDTLRSAIESNDSEAAEKARLLKRKVMALHAQIRQMAETLFRTKVVTTDTPCYAEVITAKKQIEQEPWEILSQ